MKEVSLDLESGESLVADIDITDCKTLKQDLLSIGNNISTWSKEADKHNLHIYLRKNDFSDDNLYIEYVDENYCDEMKHAFTVKKDVVTGKAILHVELTKDDLLINGKGVFTDENPVPAIYYSRDRIGDVVRFEQHEGDDHIFKIDKTASTSSPQTTMRTQMASIALPTATSTHTPTSRTRRFLTSSPPSLSWGRAIITAKECSWDGHLTLPITNAGDPSDSTATVTFHKPNAPMTWLWMPPNGSSSQYPIWKMANR